MPLTYVQSIRSKAMFLRGLAEGRAAESESGQVQLASFFYKAGRSAAMMGVGIAGAYSSYGDAVEQYDAAADDGEEQLARDFASIDSDAVDTSALDDDDDEASTDADASDTDATDGHEDPRWVTSDDGGERYYGSDSGGWLEGRAAAEARAASWADDDIPF